MDVTLTGAECEALFDLISDLSGHNPENVFAWNGADDPTDPLCSACAKVYQAAGRRVPDNLRAPPTPAGM
jgi:hypothetical protein